MSTIIKLLDISKEWLQYAIRLNLLNEKKEALVDLKCKVLNDDKIKTYLCDITDFHSTLISNHKNPDLPIHKLLFLLDIGLDCSDPKIKIAIDEINVKTLPPAVAKEGAAKRASAKADAKRSKYDQCS